MNYLIDYNQAAKVIENARILTRKYCKENNLRTIVLGLSGGLDSAVALGLVAPLSQDGVRIIPLVLPCESDPEDEELARLAAGTFRIDLIKFDITSIYRAAERKIKAGYRYGRHLDSHSYVGSYKRDLANVKARLRMACGTFFFGNYFNGLVLSTDNLSEYWMGFWTICGDVGHFGPIQNVWKGLEMPVIAGLLGVPDEIIERPPTDGLGITSTDKEQLFGLDYYDLDRVIITLLQNGFNPDSSKNFDTQNNAENDAKQRRKLPQVKGISDKIVGEVFAKMKATSFKRAHCSLGLSLTRKELGLAEIKDIDLRKL